MERQLRRRAPRVNAEYRPGKYIIDGDPLSGWNECRLVDLSLLGMALELLGPISPTHIGRRITVEMDVDDGKSISLRLAGTVRNLRRGEFGGMRAGVEFSTLTKNERSVLSMMEHLDIRW